MKTNFKNWLPAVMIAIATIGAFSTHAMTLKESNATLVEGYQQINNSPTNCDEKNMCSTINNGIVCTVDYEEDGAPLFRLEGATCNQELYRPEQ